MRFKFDPWAVDQIERRYDPEKDLPINGCPHVSWTEYALLQMVLELAERVEELEGAVFDLLNH